MDSLRKPPFFVAIALAIIIVLIEVGAGGFLNSATSVVNNLSAAVASDPELAEAYRNAPKADIDSLSKQTKPPGLGILYMALLDAVLLFTILLTASGMFIPQGVQGNIQGCITGIFAIILILTGIVMILVAVALIILMVTLLLAIPFGTIAYLILYGFFNRAAATGTLTLLMTLKLGFAVALVVAQQRFLQNKGLVLLVITSLAANVIVSVLHGIVPGILVSITDAIAGVIVAVLALIWAVVLVFGALLSIIKVAQITRNMPTIPGT
jgi:hypothetical protein